MATKIIVFFVNRIEHNKKALIIIKNRKIEKKVRRKRVLTHVNWNK